MRYGKVLPQGAFSSDCFVKIYENTLSSATTSVTISGLDGNTDEKYRLICRFINGHTGAIQVYLRPNNDSGTNYGRQDIYGTNTTITGERITSDTVARLWFSDNSGDKGLSIANIYAKSGYVRTILEENQNCLTTTVYNIYLRGQSWNNTADNITSLVISSSSANGLGVGTYISLWKLSSKV